MFLSRRFTAQPAIALCLLASSLTSVRAEIKFCNQYAKPVYVAIAYPQNYSDGSTGFISRGWLEVNTGQCQAFDNSLHVPYFFFRGETNWYNVDRRRRVKNTWGDNANQFLTAVGQFNFWDADHKETSSKSTTLTGFIKSIVDSGGDIAETVTFQADGEHDEQSVTTTSTGADRHSETGKN